MELVPRLHNSPWIRGAPHSGFSRFMQRISARKSVVCIAATNVSPPDSPRILLAILLVAVGKVIFYQSFFDALHAEDQPLGWMAFRSSPCILSAPQRKLSWVGHARMIITFIGHSIYTNLPAGVSTPGRAWRNRPAIPSLHLV
jgi:hypothetical protein